MLRKLGIYGGAQGIWVDKDRTKSITDDGSGITVGLLHTGVHYDDDLTETGVLYHYPETGRQPGRDEAEVRATRACRTHGLPVFVIHKRGDLRDVFLGWVEDWDDDLAEFLITFGDEASAPTAPVASYNAFVLHAEGRSRKRREIDARMNQNRFRFLVLKRYGAGCAVCSIAVPEVLQAAHVFEVKDGGSDDPANGLVLCSTHHAAFDKGIFAIDPEDTSLVYRERGPTKDDLRITRDDLRHLNHRPHSDALEERYARWMRD